MESEIVVEGKTYRYLSGGSGRSGVISVNGKKHEYRFLPLPDGRRICLVDGRVVEWNGLPEGLRREVRFGGGLHYLRVVDPRSRKGNVSSIGAGDKLAELKAPMPGKVVSVLLAKGSKVSTDQGVVVLEAMKMENELRSPISGVVSELDVKEGQAVETGQRIAVIEPSANRE